MHPVTLAPILTPQDIPRTLPHIVYRKAGSIYLLNPPNAGQGLINQTLGKTVRGVARLIIEVVVRILCVVAVGVHLTCALGCKAWSWLKAKNPHEKAYYSALGFEYAKAAFLEAVHTVERRNSFTAFPNRLVDHLSESEVKIDGFTNLLNDNINNAPYLGPDHTSRGLDIYNYRIRHAYRYAHVVTAQSQLERTHRCDIPINESSVLNHFQLGDSYERELSSDHTLPSTFHVNRAALSTNPNYPLPSKKSVALTVAAVALVALAGLSAIAGVAFIEIYAFPLTALLCYGAYKCYKTAKNIFQNQRGEAELKCATQLLVNKPTNHNLKQSVQFVEEVMHWLMKSAARGHPEAQRLYGLARIQSNSRNCENIDQIQEGLKWLVLAAMNDDPKALGELNGLLFLVPNPQMVENMPADEEMRLILFGQRNHPNEQDAKILFDRLRGAIAHHETAEMAGSLKQFQSTFYLLNLVRIIQPLLHHFPDVLGEIIARYAAEMEDAPKPSIQIEVEKDNS